MNWYATALVQVVIELGARLLKFSSCHIIIVKRVSAFSLSCEVLEGNLICVCTPYPGQVPDI